ncbi:uncharacterized protein LOC127252836 [Andrographis paniculata]|uniref:uncharacterized protein LOC127252836 n=1 Tax=Andrographis paniculata TaxID=175694 RepID=UPI0021E71715|nr:uncharacterized protein LOC127252836 [Andrographis paniculata]
MEGQVKEDFNSKAVNVYGQWIHDIRSERGRKPEEQIDVTILAEWRRIWSSDAVKQKSDTTKKNRLRGNMTGRAESTHTGGSRSFTESAWKLGMNKVGTYKWAHSKEHNCVTFINAKATKVADEVDAVEAHLTQQGNTSYDPDNVFLTVVPRDKKNRIYGLGSLGATVPPRPSSFCSDGRTPGTFILEERLTKMECELGELRTDLAVGRSQWEVMQQRATNMENQQRAIYDLNLTIMEQL